ncbi:MAG: radical SAM protein [Patescibacteria group bacterium]
MLKNEMLKHILLVESKRTYDKETTLETHYTYPHLGLLSIAANMETHGHKIDYFNTNIYNKPISKLKEILKNQYDYVGISSITETIDHQLKIAEIIKECSKNTKIIFGGVHAWLHPKEILGNKNVDFIIRGSGEVPFLKLVNNEKLGQIPGLCYKVGSKKIIKEPYIPTNREFQEIRSILQYSKYDEVYKETRTFRNTRHLFTSFGCPFNCNFCSVPKLYNKKMLFRNIESVLEDVKKLSKMSRRIMFVDPDLNINKKHFINLFTKIAEEKKNGNIDKKTVFVIQARLDCFDDEMLNIAKKANLIALIGVESLSQRIRDYDLNKGGKLAKMSREEVINKLEKIGKYLKTYLYFILATPETEKRDIIDNLRYIKKLKKGWYEINTYITPYPETNYYHKYKNSKFIIWRDREMEFYTRKVPKYLMCKDKEVTKHIEKSTEKATKKHKKNRRQSFSNLFLEELIKEFSL